MVRLKCCWVERKKQTFGWWFNCNLVEIDHGISFAYVQLFKYLLKKFQYDYFHLETSDAFNISFNFDWGARKLERDRRHVTGFCCKSLNLVDTLIFDWYKITEECSLASVPDCIPTIVWSIDWNIYFYIEFLFNGLLEVQVFLKT